jgi:hypothetical protein
MPLTIPWEWLAIGELTYIAVSPVKRLQETVADLRRKRVPHPRGVVIVSMMFCVAAWPLFAGWAVGGAVAAIIKGFRGVK